MIRDLLKETEDRMKGAVSSLEGDLAAFRTGRANPHLVDRIMVEMYGVEMPLNQMAVISVPEPQQIAIRPYDAQALSAIERAILKSDLGIMPNNDGKIVRLNIPRLTEERRRDLSRLVGRRVEDAKVAVRNVRRDALNDLRDFEKEKLITEDDLHRGIDELQELTNRYVDIIDKIGNEKEAEIMEV
ncbi:MAG: ribosome recycling factor [Candidatus Promineifilaceae bacterium]|nr:ribosome recycling factor [Candidatus Promineifilaceae bacterium]